MNFDRDAIFNEGCDARVLGLSWKENPYIGTPLDEYKRIWFDGWNHVNIFLGQGFQQSGCDAIAGSALRKEQN